MNDALIHHASTTLTRASNVTWLLMATSLDSFYILPILGTLTLTANNHLFVYTTFSCVYFSTSRLSCNSDRVIFCKTTFALWHLRILKIPSQPKMRQLPLLLQFGATVKAVSSLSAVRYPAHFMCLIRRLHFSPGDMCILEDSVW